MNANTNTSDAERTIEINWGIRVALAVISGIMIAGGLLRAAGYGKWEWEPLLYFLAAVLILLLPWIAKLKLGKDGFELEFFKSVKNTLEDNGVGGIHTLAASPVPVEKSDETVPPEKSADEKMLFRGPNDPQHGLWGGSELNNQRRISATIKPIPKSPDWFMVRLVVSTTAPEKPLAGKVIFHVHPTFKRPVIPVPVRGGKAVLELVAWGAFTVGAECDAGQTKLEIDLSTLSEAPEAFLLR